MVSQQNDGQFPVIQLVGMLRGIASGMRYWDSHPDAHTHTRAHIPTTEIHFTIKMEKKLFLIFQTWVWGFRFLLAISVLSDVEISCGDIRAVWSCASAAWDALSPHPDDSAWTHTLIWAHKHMQPPLYAAFESTGKTATFQLGRLTNAHTHTHTQTHAH